MPRRPETWPGWALFVASALGPVGCGGTPVKRTAPVAPPQSVGAAAREPAARVPARLVVALVYDQLGSDTLLKHLTLLEPGGAIRQAVDQGAFLERSVYPYANTVTAAGHATIHTGAPPSVSGIEGNSLWDVSKGRAVPAVDDAAHLVFGREAEGSLAVVITSDHGVAELPERHPGAAGRLFPERLLTRIEADLDAQLGEGHWLAGILTPYVYFTAEARRHARAVEMLAFTLASLRKEEGLREAWPLTEVRTWDAGSAALQRALWLGVAPDNTADIVFVVQPGYTVDLRSPAGRGTNHGSPYDYDKQVPVLGFGHGVPHRRDAEPVDQLRVAATLAQLLGIEPPAAAARPGLF